MTTHTADVVVIGGGHNGLTCACYLARAGLDVIVLEKNPELGGALRSSEWHGHRLEHGGVEHTAVLGSGVIDELDLEAHGLRYATRSVGAVHAFGDGTTLVIEESAEATAASIATLSERDAESYLRLAELATPLMKAFGHASGPWIPPRSLARRFARILGGRRSLPLLELVDLPATAIAERWFTHPVVRAMAIHRSTFIGLPPSAPGSGAAFLLTPAGHGRRYGRPIGGSAAFVAALESSLVAAGGAVVVHQRVESVERRHGGHGWAVHTAGGTTFRATRAVVSAIAPKGFLLDVLPAGSLDATTHARVERIETVSGNVNQLTLSAAIDDAGVTPDFGRSDLRQAMMWLMASPADALANYDAAARGDMIDRIPTVLTFLNEMDPAAAPAGKATTWANSFLASELRGRDWAGAAGETADAVWATIEACVPGVRGHVEHEVLCTPGDIAVWGGTENPGGHVTPTPEQSLGDRPVPGMGNYATPVEGVFLTGAGTHPGGGVNGAPGRGCARAVLRTLEGGLASRARFVTDVVHQGVTAAATARRLPHVDVPTSPTQER